MSLSATVAMATPLEQAKSELAANGYCVLADVLTRPEIVALKTRLVEQAQGERARGVSFHDGGAARPNQRV